MATVATYVRAGLPEVTTALAALTSEPHPLAITPSAAVSANREEAGKAELNGRASWSARLMPKAYGNGGLSVVTG